MKVFIAADHAGYERKNQIAELLRHEGHEVEDLGAHELDKNDDYPKYAYLLATKILGEDDSDEARGILVCGSGQGMSIAANRVRGIRAALAWSAETGKSAKEDDNANVLVLSARHSGRLDTTAAAMAWLNASFKADPKYQRRLDEIEQLYG